MYAIRSYYAAPDGAYTARMEIQYAMGNRPVANSAPFVLDTQAPKISLIGDTLVFSPNGDGVKDLAEFTRTVEGNDPWTRITSYNVCYTKLLRGSRCSTPPEFARRTLQRGHPRTVSALPTHASCLRYRPW